MEEPPISTLKAYRSESFCAIGASQASGFSRGARVNRSESLYVPPQISEQLIEKATAKQKKGKIDHTLFLKERGSLRHMINAGEIVKARELLQQGELLDVYNASAQVRGMLDALEFLSLIDSGDLPAAIEFSLNNLKQYMTDKVKLPLPGRSMAIADLTALLCYQDPHSSELGYLLSGEQKALIFESINNEIIRKKLLPI